MSDSPNVLAVAAASALATVAILAALRWVLYPRHEKIIPGPLKTVLPKLSGAEIDALVYGPDQFPGARDVPSPFGSIRAYEFGPETGRKVLLVHGISTSCLTLGPVAHALVRHAGCRVILFDLFGRGFSDGVGDLPHDDRLYAAEMLAVLASSPLSWSGEKAFDLLGYSMGGGIAVHFAAAFPHMVRSLLMLAPAGLIRIERFGAAAKFIFTSGIVPERLLAAVTRKRLRQPIASGVKAKRGAEASAVGMVAEPPSEASAGEHTSGPVDLAVAEAADTQGDALEQASPEPFGAGLSVRVMHYVRWMLTHHDGFVQAFMGSIKDAPLVGQKDAWQLLAAVVKGDGKKEFLPMLVILGQHDTVVDKHDYEEDAQPLFAGAPKVTWTLVPGGHEFPMTYSRPVVRAILNFWGGMEGALATLEEEAQAEKAELAATKAAAAESKA